MPKADRADRDADRKVSVNVSPSASVEGLHERLSEEAARRGVTVSRVAARVLVYALNNREEFRAPLTRPGRAPGKLITAKLSEDAAARLSQWAEARETTRTRLCAYLLQKALETKRVDRALED